MSTTPDLYAVLGIPRTATAAEVKKAWRKAARTHHPDVAEAKGQDVKAAEARFKEAQAAWAILGDPDRRATYDRQSARPEPQRQSQSQARPRPRPHATRQRDHDRPDPWRNEYKYTGRRHHPQSPPPPPHPPRDPFNPAHHAHRPRFDGPIDYNTQSMEARARQFFRANGEAMRARARVQAEVREILSAVYGHGEDLEPLMDLHQPDLEPL